MRTPDAVIIIKGNRYALYKKDKNRNPYMVELSTGEIPQRPQRSLLKEYLLERGVDIEPWEGPNHRTTYWCIRQAIKIAEDKQ